MHLAQRDTTLPMTTDHVCSDPLATILPDGLAGSLAPHHVSYGRQRLASADTELKARMLWANLRNKI